MEANINILSELGNYYKKKNLKLPSGIEFVQDSKDCIRMILSAEKVQTSNMQKDDNAFEGWAISIYIGMKRTISVVLDINDTFKYEQYEKNGHLGRFLYRAYRFAEQYDWFSLSGTLTNETRKYMDYLENADILVNNIGSCEAKEKKKNNKENLAEAKLSEKDNFKKYVTPTMGFGNNNIYRQLPVGLFKGKVNRNNMLFTGGKSAIDLWTWNKSDFCVIELKTGKNMVGIVTEIFFYSNYMRDMLKKDGIFSLNKDLSKRTTDDRGYSELMNHSFETINGMMLADKYHLFITQEVVDVLNAGTKDDIKYIIAKYDLNKLMK